MRLDKSRNTKLRTDCDLLRGYFGIVAALIGHAVKLNLTKAVAVNRRVIVPHIQRCLASVKSMLTQLCNGLLVSLADGILENLAARRTL